MYKKWEQAKDEEEKLKIETELALKGGIAIDQVYYDNESAINDYKYAKEAARVLDAEDFGPDDEWDLNKDPENHNITHEQFL